MQAQLIESSVQMEELLSSIADKKLLAVDTEFQRETSYYPKLALVQIATEDTIACIDPLAFDARPALRKLLLDKEITKIFHSCSQDLEVLHYYLDETPVTIYDTQIAHAFLSDHHQIGYASLVEEEIGVQLDKSQTRTDWLRRPLTDKQIRYAGDDVLYLFQLHALLQEKLTSRDMTQWFEEECEALNSYSDFDVDLSSLWRRVKGASRLPRKQLNVAQAIAVWRERLAQQYDRTRRRILDDDTIIALSTQASDSLTDEGVLAIINNGRRSDIKLDHRMREDLLDHIIDALNRPEEQWPDNRFITLDDSQKKLLKKLQQVVASKADTLGIASAVICSRRDIERLILNYDGDEKNGLGLLRGWRRQCIGDTLLETISGFD